MIILSWNCCGLARSAAVCQLQAMVHLSNPDCLFLMETKVDVNSMTQLVSFLGFILSTCVPPVGLSGGLFFCWKQGVDIEVTSQNKSFINLLIFSNPLNQPWMLTALYGPPIHFHKPQFWQSLLTISNSFMGPWLCIDDLNCILTQAEKRGGLLFTSSMSRGFDDFMADAGLISLGFSGSPFTWTNKRPFRVNIKERLDQAIANLDWRSLFSKACLKHFPISSFDHLPICLDTNGDPHIGPRPFKFEEIWTRDKNSSLVVKKGWSATILGSP